MVARTQLLEAGASPDAIKHRLQRARLHRLHRGVYAAGHANVGELGRELAAVFACGPGPLLALDSAGGRWEIRPPWRGAIHVVSSRVRMHRGVIGHRTRLLAPGDAP